MKRKIERRRGQGMTEYIIIVGLLAILLVGAVGKFKDALENSYNKAAGVVERDVAGRIDEGPGAAPAAATTAAAGATDPN